MSRETRINRTIRRALERQVQKIEATKPPRRNKVLRLLAFVRGTPGVLAAFLALLPRVTVTASDPPDPANPFFHLYARQYWLHSFAEYQCQRVH